MDSTGAYKTKKEHTSLSSQTSQDHSSHLNSISIGPISNVAGGTKLSHLSEELNRVHLEMPENLQDVENTSLESLFDFEDYSAIMDAENLWGDGYEDSQDIHELGCGIQYAEAAPTSHAKIMSPLPTHIPKEYSVSLAPSCVKSSELRLSALHLNAAPPSTTTGSTEGLTNKRMKSYKLVISPYKPGNPTVSVSTMNESSRFDDANFVTSNSSSMLQPFTSSSYPEFASVGDDNKKTSPADHARNSKKFNQTTNAQKPITIDTEDSQQCTCKRSACAKLYCECLAAELYCGKNCSCLGCLNRPEFREEIHKVRQEIISHDPFAFAPKIVQNVTNIPPNNKGCENSYDKKTSQDKQDDWNKERERRRDEEVQRLSPPKTPSLLCCDMADASAWDWKRTPRGHIITLFGGRLHPLRSSMPFAPVSTNPKKIVPSFPPTTPSTVDSKDRGKGNGDLDHEENSGDGSREPKKRLRL